MLTFSEKIIQFNKNLKRDFDFKKLSIEIINPFKDNPDTTEAIKAFYNKFYNDTRERHLILGINPGRFGSGVTGIPFTDTKRLIEECGIGTVSSNKHEVSSEFIYDVINAYGGSKEFYKHYYVSSVCPIGFTKINRSGKRVNYNYYDDVLLTASLRNFIVKSIKQQMAFGIKNDVCYCLGSGRNAKFLIQLNNEYHFFKRIVPLEHPRYIMQYKNKNRKEYISKYLYALKGKA